MVVTVNVKVVARINLMRIFSLHTRRIIGTMRSKTAWEVQKDDRTGKTNLVKVGLAPVQREGLEFEFTCVLKLSVDGHIASASKDRTSLFDNQYFVPGIETGKNLLDWLSGGNWQSVHDGPKHDHQEFQATSPFDQASPIGDNGSKPTTQKLFNLLRELGLGSKVKHYEHYVVANYGHSFKDMTTEELSEQVANLEKCLQDSELP
jgi:hypothetical protein